MIMQWAKVGMRTCNSVLDSAVASKIEILSMSFSLEHMGGSFQDYSWIQDFEADFPQKVSLKMLN